MAYNNRYKKKGNKNLQRSNTKKYKTCIQAMIFCKDYHLESLIKHFKLSEYPELKKCEKQGCFTISILTVISETSEERAKSNNIISALKIKRENRKINSVSQCRDLYGNNEILAYPASSKKIKQIKPNYKLKLVQIVL